MKAIAQGEKENLYVYIYLHIYICIFKKNLHYIWFFYSGQLKQHIWSLQQNINDEEIKMLSKALPFVIESGLANSTNKKYFHGWKTWVDWCNSKQEVDLCPADPFYVTIFLNHILFTSGKKGSVITTFYRIRWGHQLMGFDSPTNNAFVQLAFEGCQRLCWWETTKKEPTTSEMIKSLVNKFGGRNASLPDLRFLLTCLIGFSGFLRIEELLSIEIKHLRISESHLEILVPKSKTEQHREEHIVYISWISSECCPVKFLEYLQKTNIEISKDGETPLIGRIFKSKKRHKISQTQWISYLRIRDVFKDYINDITANLEKYGLHSLWAGKDSTAGSNVVTDRVVSKQGWWSSEKVKNGYIKGSVNTRLSVSKMLGL